MIEVKKNPPLNNITFVVLCFGKKETKYYYVVYIFVLWFIFDFDWVYRVDHCFELDCKLQQSYSETESLISDFIDNTDNNQTITLQ